MARTISATEAKNRLGAYLSEVADRDEAVVIEAHGKPRAVLISFAAYQEDLTRRERERRAEAVRELRELSERIRDRGLNRDLTEEQVEALADQVSHEIIDDLAKRGVLRFERDVR